MNGLFGVMKEGSWEGGGFLVWVCSEVPPGLFHTFSLHLHRFDFDHSEELLLTYSCAIILIGLILMVTLRDVSRFIVISLMNFDTKRYPYPLVVL